MPVRSTRVSLAVLVTAAAACVADQGTDPVSSTPVEAAYADVLREADALAAELRATTWDE